MRVRERGSDQANSVLKDRNADRSIGYGEGRKRGKKQ